MATSLLTAEDILTDAQMDTWDALFLATPKKKWTKVEPVQRADESAQHFAYRLIYSQLVKKGMRTIGQFSDWPWDEAWLSQVLFHDHLLNAVRYAEKVTGEPFTKYNGFTVEVFRTQWLGMCRRASRWALANFDPDVYKMLQERGRRGGSVVKYGMAQYLEIRHMTPTEAKKHLGCARKTVYNMRDRYEDIISESESEEVKFPEERNNWPATAKQRAYGIALEDGLVETRSDWPSMTVSEASERIDYLLQLRALKNAVNAAFEEASSQ